MGITVYLVEDHQMTLVGLTLLLEKDPDIQLVGESRDGASAVKQITEIKPNVVLMDIGLPEMDGIEATQKIKATLPDTKIVMLTSKDSETEVFAALAAGADAYCLKGIPPETLSVVIQAVNEGTAWLDPGIARLVLGRFAGTSPIGSSSMEIPL